MLAGLGRLLPGERGEEGSNGIYRGVFPLRRWICRLNPKSFRPGNHQREDCAPYGVAGSLYSKAGGFQLFIDTLFLSGFFVEEKKSLG